MLGSNRETAIKKLFEVAHITYYEGVLDTAWRSKYVWSVEEMHDFRDWLVSFLKESKAARQEFMKIPVKSEKHLLRAANTFINMYGWKINYESKRNERR